MCKQTYERYAECGCPYYKHAIDPCSECGRKGHTVSVRLIDVGYKCREHDRSQDSQGKSSTDGEEASLPDTMPQDSPVSKASKAAWTPLANLSDSRQISRGSKPNRRSSSEYYRDIRNFWTNERRRDQASASNIVLPCVKGVRIAHSAALKLSRSIKNLFSESSHKTRVKKNDSKGRDAVDQSAPGPNDQVERDVKPDFDEISPDMTDEDLWHSVKTFDSQGYVDYGASDIKDLPSSSSLPAVVDPAADLLDIPEQLFLFVFNHPGSTSGVISMSSRTGRLGVLAIEACPADTASLRAWAWSALDPSFELTVRISGHLPSFDAIIDKLNEDFWMDRVCLVCGELCETDTCTNHAWYLDNLEEPICESCGFHVLRYSKLPFSASRKRRTRRKGGVQSLTGVRVKESDTAVTPAMTFDLSWKFLNRQTMAAPGIRYLEVSDNEERSTAVFDGGSQLSSRYSADLRSNFDGSDRRILVLLDMLDSEEPIDLFPLHGASISRDYYPWRGQGLGNINVTIVRPADIYTSGWFFRTKCPFCDVWFAGITFLAFWESRMSHVSQHPRHAKELHASRHHQILWHARIIRNNGARPYPGNSIGNYPRIWKSSKSKRPRLNDRANEQSDALSTDPGLVGQRLRLVTQPGNTNSASMGSASKVFQASPNGLDNRASPQYNARRLIAKSCPDILLHYILPLISFVRALPFAEATLALAKLRPKRTRTISWTCVSYTFRDQSKGIEFRAFYSIDLYIKLIYRL